MPSNKGNKDNKITSVKAALAGYDEIQAWMAANPIKVTDAETKEVKMLDRTAIGLTVNADAGLYYASIQGLADAPGARAGDDLAYNAQTVGLRKALWAAFSGYAPTGYVFDPGEIGSRGGEGVTAQLTATKVVVNELVQTLVPLVKSGMLSIDQVPESSRAAIQALLAA